MCTREVGEMCNLHKQLPITCQLLELRKMRWKKTNVTKWLGNVQVIVMIKALLSNGFLAPVKKMTTSFKVE